jgi:DNA polymerase elongation subunit (family B)
MDVPKVRNASKFHYEADVQFPYRFRYDKKIKSGFEYDDNLKDPIPCDSSGLFPYCVCIDIETMDDADAEQAASPIVSISLKDDVKDKYMTFITTSKKIDVDKVKEIIDGYLGAYKDYKGINFAVKEYTVESLMLIKFNQFLNDVVQPDVLYGWNYTEFDQKYLENRAGNVMDFESFQEFDLLHAYKTLTENELVSGKLDDVSKDVLGIGKLPRTTIKELLETDPDRLVAYNIIDVYLTSEINRKRDIIKFHQTLAEMAGGDLDGTKYHSNIVDSVLMHFVRGKAILPSKGMLSSGNIEQGGRVHDASTGVRKNIAVVDLSRAYPTTIQENNLSPETKLGMACDVCLSKDGCAKPEKKDMIGCDIFSSTISCYKMPSGRCYRKNPIGLVPAVFMDLISKRKEFQKKMKDAIASKNKDDEKKYFEMQRAIKYIMNAFYGVLGSIDEHGKGKFRLADGEIGSDVTESIRLLNHWMEDHLSDISKLKKYINADESVMFEMMESNKSKIIPIYADTDSVLFEFPTEDYFEDKDMMIRQIELVAKLLNRSFKDFAMKLSGSNQGLYEVEFEKLYDTFFQGGTKKRYAGLFAWKKGVWMDNRSFDERKEIRGYELRRSDSSKFMRDHQLKLFEIILTTMNRDEVSAAIQDWKHRFLSGEFNVDIKVPKGIGQATYDKSNPIQLRAASYSNKFLGKEFKPPCKVFYCYMKSVKAGPGIEVIGLDIDDDPSDYGVIDFDMMYDKQFVAPFKRIIEPIWGVGSWVEIEQGLKQVSLEEFF